VEDRCEKMRRVECFGVGVGAWGGGLVWGETEQSRVRIIMVGMTDTGYVGSLLLPAL